MHRSGTSLITHGLSRMGLETGDNLIEALPSNPEGFWEDKDVVKINDLLLSDLNLSWESIPSLFPLSGYKLWDDYIFKHAKDIITRKLRGNNATNVIKDPRMSVLLSFWLDVFNDCNVEPIFIYVVREPEECAKSLETRDQFSIEKGMSLWFNYNHSITRFLSNKKNLKCQVVLFDDFFSKTDKVSQKIVIFLSKFLDEQFNFNEFKKVIKNELRNEKKSKVEISEDIRSQVYYLYDYLLKISCQDYVTTEQLRNIIKNIKYNEFFNNSSNDLNRGLLFQLYFDFGHGYSEENSTKFIFYNRRIRQTINIYKFGDISRIRIDPAARQCVVLINNIEAVFNDGRKERVFIDNGNFIQKKGSLYFFNTNDPQFEFDFKKDLKELDIDIVIVDNPYEILLLMKQDVMKELSLFSKKLDSNESYREKSKTDFRYISSEMLSKINNLRINNTTLSKKLKEKMKEIDESKNVITHLKEIEADYRKINNNNLKKELEVVNKEKQIIIKSLNKAEMKNEELQDETKSKQTEKEVLEGKYRLLQHEFKIVRSKKKEIINNFNKIQSEIDELEQQLIIAKKEVENLKREIKSREQTTNDLLNEKDKQLQSLTDLNNSLRDEISVLKNENSINQDNMFALDDELEKYRIIVDSLMVNKGKSNIRYVLDKFKSFYRFIIKPKKTIRINEDIKFLCQNGGVDINFYLNKYLDIKLFNIDPIKHYCTYGWKEGRSPSTEFDTMYYLERNGDVKDAEINPFVHYLKYGKNEGRFPSEKIEKQIRSEKQLWSEKGLNINFDDISKYLLSDSKVTQRPLFKPIDIIIPVYNGYDKLVDLLYSVMNNTREVYRCFIINDASPDTRIKQFLQEYCSRYDNFHYLENENNIGFVNTVNKGFELCDHDIVILNSDVVVPEGWLQRLMMPLEADPKVATTTPFTNSGTICSFPVFLEDNPLYLGYNVNEIDRAFKLVNSNNIFDTPTGVGFCMGIRKEVIDRIGNFDSEAFGKGYCEENDLCQRAIQAGYKNIIVPNLFVYHHHGGSFAKKDKKRFINDNYIKLTKRWPNYEKDVHSLITRNPAKYLRIWLKILVKSINTEDVTAYFDHNIGGGTNHYTFEKINMIVKRNGVAIRITYLSDMFNLEYIAKDEHIRIDCKNITQVFILLEKIQIKEVVINHLLGLQDIHSFYNELLSFKKRNSFAKIKYMLHDYMAICPSYTLINEKGEYCRLPEIKICETCSQKVKKHELIDDFQDIYQWRIIWSDILEVCDDIIVFSNYSGELLKKVYPEQKEKILCVPHDTSYFMPEPISSNESNTFNIGVIGGIVEKAKGAEKLEELSEYIYRNNIRAKIVVFGISPLDRKYGEIIKSTGKYNLEQLPGMVEDENIHVLFMPSVWPETFSYVTAEMIKLGLPVACFDMGGQMEQVIKYEKGVVLKINEKIEDVFKILNNLYQKVRIEENV